MVCQALGINHTYTLSTLLAPRNLQEGVWAGHMELQATSLLLQRNIYIYQVTQCHPILASSILA
jgi:hypothetical protein